MSKRTKERRVNATIQTLFLTGERDINPDRYRGKNKLLDEDDEDD